MSGFCSAHQGHDPNCRICASSTPEQIKEAQAFWHAFRHGCNRGAEAVAEWLEGAQWDDKGMPCKRDPLRQGDREVSDEDAKIVAAYIRRRFVRYDEEDEPEEQTDTFTAEEMADFQERFYDVFGPAEMTVYEDPGPLQSESEPEEKT